MPRVPQSDLPSIGLQTGAMPQFQASQVAPAQNFMGQQLQQLGQGVEQAGAGLLRLGDRINDSRVRAADTQFSEWSRSALSEYRNKKGRDAVDTREQYLKDLAQKQKELADGLDNQWQREMFSERAAYRAMQFNTYVDDHFQGQATAYEVGEADAALKASFKDYQEQYSTAATMPQGPVNENAYYRNAMQQAAVIARAKGIPTDSAQFKAMTQEVEDNLHIGAMMAMTESQEPASRQMARDYFKQNGERISLPNRQKVQAAIKAMDVDDDSFALSNELRGYSKGLGNQLEMLDQLRMIGDIDGTTYNATREKLERSFRSDETAQNQRRNTLTEQMHSSMLEASRANSSYARWLANNNGLADALRSEGMLPQAEQFWAAGARTDTREGLDWLSSVQVGAVSIQSQPWANVMAEANRLGLSNASIDRLEAAYIKYNNLERGPASGRSRKDMVELVSREDFNRLLVEKVFGEPYDPKWSTKDGGAEGLAKAQRWTQVAQDMSDKMNADGVDPSDREAMKKWANNYVATYKPAAGFKMTREGVVVTPIDIEVDWDRLSVEEKQNITFQVDDGKGNTANMTLHDWVNDDAMQAQALRDAQEYSRELKLAGVMTPAQMQEADRIDIALQESDLNGGRPTAGVNQIMEVHLKAQIARGQQAAKMQAEETMRRAVGQRMIEQGLNQTKWDLADFVREYLPPEGGVSVKSAIANVDAFLKFAQDRNVFGTSVDWSNQASMDTARQLMLGAISRAAEPAQYTTPHPQSPRLPEMLNAETRIMLPGLKPGAADAKRAIAVLQDNEKFVKQYFAATGLWRELYEKPLKWSKQHGWRAETNIANISERFVDQAVRDGRLPQEMRDQMMSGTLGEQFKMWLYKTLQPEAERLQREERSQEAAQQRAKQAQELEKQRVKNVEEQNTRLRNHLEATRKQRGY